MSKTHKKAECGGLKKFNDRIYVPMVWFLRITIGALFVFAGFTKAIDPWGFVYKIDDYLGVWGVDFIWREVVLSTAVVLAAAEFVVGVLLITGCLRRSICLILLLFMLFMLPLTAYIMLYNPVADCGCFGDALILSNNATFIKNVYITLGAVYLLFNNYRVGGLYAKLVQWLVIVVSVLYCFIISFVGYIVQPMIDFRPYPVGTRLTDDSDDDMLMVYEKDGVEKSFKIDSLPDSTWTYVRRSYQPKILTSQFAIFDGDEEVTNDVLTSEGRQLLLMIADPQIHRKNRASMSNNLNTYIEKIGGNMIGVVGTVPDSLEAWKAQAHPNYDVYTADDTTIKEVVRGDAALVYLRDGKIVWKRNLYSLPGDFPEFSGDDNALDSLEKKYTIVSIDKLTRYYLLAMFLIWLLGMLRMLRRKKKADRQSKPVDIIETVLQPEEISQVNDKQTKK